MALVSLTPAWCKQCPFSPKLLTRSRPVPARSKRDRSGCLTQVRFRSRQGPPPRSFRRRGRRVQLRLPVVVEAIVAVAVAVAVAAPSGP